MHLRITNIPTQTLDACRFSCGSAGALELVNEPEAYTKEELAALHSQVLSNLEQAWELLGGSEDQLLSTMMQISQVVARQFNKQE